LRLNPDGITKRTIPFELGAVLDSLPGANMHLQPEDEVIIHEIEIGTLTDKFVEVKGSVRFPGKFALASDMTLTDAIVLAGGYTENAWKMQAEISRMVPVGMGKDSLAVIRFARLPDLSDTTTDRTVMSDTALSGYFHLQHRDIVYVRPDPDFEPQQNVTVEGQVNYPGDYALKAHSEHVSSIISRAGGLTKSGYLGGGRLLRGGVRVNVDFEEALDSPGGKYDVILHEGDVLSIPRKPNAVQVFGQVNNPGILGYIDGDNLHNYIDRAGGVQDSADYYLVQFPSGEVRKCGNGFLGTGLFRRNPTVPDGSTITVTKVPPPPPATEGIDTGTTIKDMFAILTSAVTIIYLAYHFSK
jgi:protein involved in polysaccharide export with SLBB domain